MKKHDRKKLQLRPLTIRLLTGQLDHAGGGLTNSENYSMRIGCSTSCMCSLPCTQNSCPPCVA
jgi:hypothetical protein